MILTAERRRPERRWRPADPTSWTSFCRTSPDGGTLRGPSSDRERAEVSITSGDQDKEQNLSEFYLQQDLYSEDGGEGVVCITQDLHKHTRQWTTNNIFMDSLDPEWRNNLKISFRCVAARERDQENSKFVLLMLRNVSTYCTGRDLRLTSRPPTSTLGTSKFKSRPTNLKWSQFLTWILTGQTRYVPSPDHRTQRWVHSHHNWSYIKTGFSRDHQLTGQVPSSPTITESTPINAGNR